MGLVIASSVECLMFSVECIGLSLTLCAFVSRLWALGFRVQDPGFRIGGQVQGLRKRARNERGEGILEDAASGSLGLERASDVGCAR